MYSVPVSFVSYRREPRRIAPRRHTTYKVTTHRSPGISYHSPGFMPHEFGMDPFMNDTMGMWNHHLNLNDVEPEKTEWTERIVCTGYAPDEVTLNVNGDKLEIHCVHKEGEEDDQEIREKKRTIEIPDNVNAEDISADMTDAGILVLTAPLIPAEEEETPSAEAASSSSEADKTKGIDITRESASTTSSEKKKADDSDNTREIAITTKKEEKKVKVKEPKKPYELEVDMRDYKPESIEVKLSDNSLTVIGNQEKSDSFTGRKSSRSLTRNFFIPLDVDTDRLSSKLNAEGKLKITAPYKGEEQTIPVKKN